MADVLASVKILPKSAETDLETLKSAIQEAIKPPFRVHRIDEEPIAFGLKALRAHIIIPENQRGGTSPIEDILGSLSGVGQVDVEMVRRI